MPKGVVEFLKDIGLKLENEQIDFFLDLDSQLAILNSKHAIAMVKEDLANTISKLEKAIKSSDERKLYDCVKEMESEVFEGDSDIKEPLTAVYGTLNKFQQAQLVAHDFDRKLSFDRYDLQKSVAIRLCEKDPKLIKLLSPQMESLNPLIEQFRPQLNLELVDKTIDQLILQLVRLKEAVKAGQGYEPILDLIEKTYVKMKETESQALKAFYNELDVVYQGKILVLEGERILRTIGDLKVEDLISFDSISEKNEK